MHGDVPTWFRPSGRIYDPGVPLPETPTPPAPKVPNFAEAAGYSRMFDLITRLQGTKLRRDLPAWWILHTLYAGLFNAWEAISDGRLAPLDAPRFVLTTVFEGVSSAGAADRT